MTINANTSEGGLPLVQLIPDSAMDMLGRHPEWTIGLPFGQPVHTHLKLFHSGRSSVQINGGVSVVFHEKLDVDMWVVALYPTPGSVISLYWEDEGLPTMMANLVCFDSGHKGTDEDEEYEPEGLDY